MSTLAARTSSCLALLFSSLLCGCGALGYSVQAPYDSFICYDSSFEECLGAVQGKQLASFYKGAYHRVRTPPIKNDPAENPRATKDGQYSCNFGTLPYTSALNPNERASIVFVSPILLSQLGEQQVKLKKARESCSRTIQAYDYQLDILDNQDALSKFQKLVAHFTTQIEQERNINQKVGAGFIADPDADLLGAAHSSVKVEEGLVTARTSITDQSELLRQKYKKQTLSEEFRKLFENANLAIDAQLRELGRELFVLDRATIQGELAAWSRREYATGSWVQKGTIVLHVKEAR